MHVLKKKYIHLFFSNNVIVLLLLIQLFLSALLEHSWTDSIHLLSISCSAVSAII